MLGSGALLALFGVIPILTLDLATPLRSASVLAWLAYSAAELGRMARTYARVSGFRLDSALEFEMLGRGGRWLPASLAPGSIVLDRAIWLRYRNSEGRASAELVTGNGRESQDFRRLKVLLRLGEVARKG